MKILAGLDTLWIFLIVIAFFAVVAIVAYVIHKILRPKLKDEEKNDEQKNAQEELDRILQPVEDDKVSEEIQNYKEDDD